MKKEKSAYAKAGVDIDAAEQAVSRMKSHIDSTRTPEVLSRVGSFGGLFDVSLLKKLNNPVLVQSIDGVGTKIMVAEMMDQWTVGQDIVHHCINDILTIGALPLTFLDYIGAAKLQPEVMEKIIAQMAIACKEAGIPLISGETAEMPGVYQKGCHDLVGCITGVVEKDKIIDGSKIAAGDLLIGLSSDGLHTNGYSLARRAFFETKGYVVDTHLEELGHTVGEELLRIHRSYLPELTLFLHDEDIEIHGIAHITGGGLIDNIARLLSEGLYVEINRKWTIPPVFRLIQEIENVSEQEMRQVFNLGVGMVLIIPHKSLRKIISWMQKRDFNMYIPIGEVKEADSEDKNQKVIFSY